MNSLPFCRISKADGAGSNIGNARPAGLQADLGLTNNQFSIALTVTYVPYIAAELPLTLALKKM